MARSHNWLKIKMRGGTRAATSTPIRIEQLRGDEAISEADTLLLTVPDQLGADYNAHVIESILAHVAPALGWRDERS